MDANNESNRFAPNGVPDHPFPLRIADQYGAVCNTNCAALVIDADIVTGNLVPVSVAGKLISDSCTGLFVPDGAPDQLYAVSTTGQLGADIDAVIKADGWPVASTAHHPRHPDAVAQYGPDRASDGGTVRKTDAYADGHPFGAAHGGAL